MRETHESSVVVRPIRRKSGWPIAWTGAVLVHALALGVATLVIAGSDRGERDASHAVDRADDVVTIDLRATMPRSATRASEPMPEPPPLDRAYHELIVDDETYVRAETTDLEQLFTAESSSAPPSAPAVAHAEIDASHFARRMPHKSGSAAAGALAAKGAQPAGGGNGNGATSSGATQPAILLPPVVISNPQPVYPPQAARRHEEGAVRCRIHLRADGCVQSVEVVRSSGFLDLDKAALDALLKWRFHPAKCDGLPIACQVEQVLTFDLRSTTAR
jgi:protein TonB